MARIAGKIPDSGFGEPSRKNMHTGEKKKKQKLNTEGKKEDGIGEA